MNYATGCAFNLDDLFMNLDKSKLKITSILCDKLVHDRHKDALIRQIFKESVKLIFKDILDNNVTFELPTGSRKSDIHVQRYSNDDFAAGRRNGKWKDIDFLKSYFTGYQLILTMYGRHGGMSRIKPIYLDKKYKQILTDYTNDGKQYC